MKTKKDIYIWIRSGIGQFKEWYQPVDFGNGVVAYETRPPYYQPLKDSLKDIGGGMAKWNYILKRNLPLLKGKRILDLGCSVGVFSIECAKLGAKKVIGIDRSESFGYRSNSTLPKQNVVQQAEFVKKAFELINKTTYPVQYIAWDIGKIEQLNLSKFDVILALCIVYHELENTEKLVKYLSQLTNYLVLQANQVHTDRLGNYSNKMYLVSLLDKYGFDRIVIDSPLNYPLPVIVGSRRNI